jgi:flagellar basal-body rod modification protein FlgD
VGGNPAEKRANNASWNKEEQGGEMATAILNHHLTAAQALTGNGATPMAGSATGTSSTSSSSSASGSSATISANDFLTLLVTEMKNQDPTANTDPNEYINQLVNVNSLEQLISINQTLTTALGSSPSSPTGGTTPGAAAASTGGLAGEAANSPGAQAQAAHPGSGLAAAQPASSGGATTVPGAISAATAQLAPGNLSVSAANPAAERVAQSLSGRPRVQ